VTTIDQTLDAPAALELAGPDCRVAVVARREGAVIQPDLAGHDDDAILAAGELDVAPMAVGSAVAAPDASTLEVEVPAGSGPEEDERVDVRVETPDGLWSGPGTIVGVAAGRDRDHRRLTITLARPLAARARRSQFRFPLPEAAEIAAALWPMAEPAATRTASDPDFEPRAIAPLGIAGRALELGGGGAGVVMPTADLEWLEWFDRFLLGLGRPGRPHEAAIRTTVRIASRVDRDDATTRLGLEFEVARSSGSPQHAYLYVEVLKLIEAVRLAERRPAA
jgi:hypothetical protein